MLDKFLSVVHHSVHQLQEQIRTNTEVVSGSFVGSITGAIIAEGWWTSLIPAIVFSLLTGAAGAIGGLTIKLLYNWIDGKIKSRNAKTPKPD